MAGNFRDRGRNNQTLDVIKPKDLTFGLLTSEEVVSMSVTKIITSNTFDLLGHPVPGGLYDPAMGPLKSESVCTTCLKNAFNCPGHMGYIDLPLPVINPLFHKVVVSVLNMSCLNCHTVTIPYESKLLLIYRLRLLEMGYLKEAQNSVAFNELFDKPSEFTKEVYEFILSEKIENYLKQIFAKNNDLVGEVRDTKCIHSLRDSYISETMSLNKNKVCLNCKSRKQTVKNLQKRLVTNIKVEVAKKFQDPGGSTRKPKDGGQTFIMPSETMTHLQKIWRNDSKFLMELIPILKKTECTYPTDLFFFKVIPVPPPISRPVNFVNGKVVEHIQNNVYKAILDGCYIIRSIIHLMKVKESSAISDECKVMITSLQGASYAEKLQHAWQNLENNCSYLFAENPKNRNSIDAQGLKQILEKKEGIIRMHMMGKRVNFAARSVITPDPNLNIDEIGIPEEFAMKLTYPVPVTPWNVKLLRKMVMNGPNVHPGAVIVELEDGMKSKISAVDPTQRESIANRLLTPTEKVKGMKIVHRHLINGDVLLMNRQPTLHKPSIMAHKARVLKGEKTIRLHYSNCKSYNADFDGDEMNAHFPQNELARSEAYNIVSVCKQYLVPKDGTPLGGLIQDHMISGVRLSIRGKFFTQDDYMQLVFQALPYIQGDIKTLPPAILKPARLWSGKQVISTVILNIIPKGKVPINLVSKAKISFKAWEKGPARCWLAGGTPFKDPNNMTEAEVIIRSGELLCGVLDKTHYGSTPYSLIHCMYELYGGECSTRLLSSFGKLFAAFLQIEGFTLGVQDILVTKEVDEERTEYMNMVRQIGHEAAASALDIPSTSSELEIKIKLEEAYKMNPKFQSIIDRQYKNVLDTYTNKINAACIPNGLIQSFPDNNLQLMVQSGAKGSTVNTMQISCLLGQIELEGKRPPLMVSGRSLPSFPPYDTSARAGGFIDGRFMTGIQPQEFFFHCMAGREGLIDTAVKTSRSGYLQRCLIKHLEGLAVNYDLTVRDSDGSIVQFLYGEDGMDVIKAQFLKKQQIPFLVQNSKAILDNDSVDRLKCETDIDIIKKHHKQMKKWKKYNGARCRKTGFTVFCIEMSEQIMQERMSGVSPMKRKHDIGRSETALTLCKMWQELDEETKTMYYKKVKRRPDPLSSTLQSDRHFGAISENMDSLLNDYLKNRSDLSCNKSVVQDMMNLKAMTSLCHPGEPVGILAAQSIGEPSTQMTLNTFHFAGRGDMNVTLGIPRLREVLMMAAKCIKTPSIEVPFNSNFDKFEKEADKLRKTLTRITLADVLESVTVEETQDLSESKRRKIYVLYFKVLHRRMYKDKTHIKPHHVLKHIEKKFINELQKAVHNKKKKKDLITESNNSARRKRVGDDNNDEEDGADNAVRHTVDSEDSSDEEIDDEDATATRRRARRQEEQEYQEKEEEEKLDEDEEKEEIEDDEVENNRDRLVDEKEEEERTNAVLLNAGIEGYRFDTEKQLWCEVTLSYPHQFGRIDFATLLKERAPLSVISEITGIRRAFTYKDMDDNLLLKTDGRNFTAMFQYADLLNLNKLYSNDIHGIAETYGIEAAVKVLVKEVKDVFNVYGIGVDPRHLLLIADYMTFDGTIQPLNRVGIEGNLSALQQMSFESASRFLTNAVLKGKKDSLSSPSSRLIVGQPCKSGTGILDVRLSSSVFLNDL